MKIKQSIYDLIKKAHEENCSIDAFLNPNREYYLFSNKDLNLDENDKDFVTKFIHAFYNIEEYTPIPENYFLFYEDIQDGKVVFLRKPMMGRDFKLITSSKTAFNESTIWSLLIREDELKEKFPWIYNAGLAKKFDKIVPQEDLKKATIQEYLNRQKLKKRKSYSKSEVENYLFNLNKYNREKLADLFFNL